MKKILFLIMMAMIFASCKKEVTTVVGYCKDYRQTNYILVVRTNGDTIPVHPMDRQVINSNEEWGRRIKIIYPIGSKYIRKY